MLVLGDTNSCLAVIPAKRKKIPIFHMEAGNRCFDQRVPEETNRKLVDHIADINLPYSTIARDYLIAEGIPADRVIKTGSPIYEVLTHYSQEIDSSKILESLGIEKGNITCEGNILMNNLSLRGGILRDILSTNESKIICNNNRLKIDDDQY